MFPLWHHCLWSKACPQSRGSPEAEGTCFSLQNRCLTGAVGKKQTIVNCQRVLRQENVSPIYNNTSANNTSIPCMPPQSVSAWWPHCLEVGYQWLAGCPTTGLRPDGTLWDGIIIKQWPKKSSLTIPKRKKIKCADKKHSLSLLSVLMASSTMQSGEKPCVLDSNPRREAILRRTEVSVSCLMNRNQNHGVKRSLCIYSPN